jgi:hypothetical protein
MIRCTIELLPGGSEEGKRIIGLVEIANIGGTVEVGDYAVVLKKSPPFAGALKQAWRRGRVQFDKEKAIGVVEGDDEELITARVGGHHRLRGPYDLLCLALKACWP